MVFNVTMETIGIFKWEFNASLPMTKNPYFAFCLSEIFVNFSKNFAENFIENVSKNFARIFGKFISV